MYFIEVDLYHQAHRLGVIDTLPLDPSKHEPTNMVVQSRVSTLDVLQALNATLVGTFLAEFSEQARDALLVVQSHTTALAFNTLKQCAKDGSFEEIIRKWIHVVQNGHEEFSNSTSAAHFCSVLADEIAKVPPKVEYCRLMVVQSVFKRMLTTSPADAAVGVLALSSTLLLSVLGALLVTDATNPTAVMIAENLTSAAFKVDRTVAALFGAGAGRWSGRVVVSTKLQSSGGSVWVSKWAPTAPGDSHGCALFLSDCGRCARVHFGSPNPSGMVVSDWLKNRRDFDFSVVNVSVPHDGAAATYFTSFSLPTKRMWRSRAEQVAIGNAVIEWQASRTYARLSDSHCWSFVGQVCEVAGCQVMYDAFINHSASFREAITAMTWQKSFNDGRCVVAQPAPLSAWESFTTHAEIDAAHMPFRSMVQSCDGGSEIRSPQDMASMDQFVAFALAIHLAHTLRGEPCAILNRTSDSF